MKTALTVAIKEYKDSFFSPIAYVFITVFLILTFWLFFADFFLREQANLKLFFDTAVFLFPIFLPAVTMGCWAEEKKNGSLEILVTLPVSDFDLVAGKFLAAFLLLLTALAPTLALVITTNILGDLDLGQVAGGYIGLILLGASSIALGLFISSLTENPIIAFIVTFLILALFHLIGSPVVGNYVPQPVQLFLNQASLLGHFQSVARGVIDSRDIFYYLSFIGFFIYSNILSLESRKWEA